ncbi:Sodium:dicarboxylate symport protein [Chlamydia trachomatis]|nr:Sodium:dicarboxylate symport protein [Chlamydia trachomatis]
MNILGDAVVTLYIADGEGEFSSSNEGEEDILPQHG